MKYLWSNRYQLSNAHPTHCLPYTIRDSEENFALTMPSRRLSWLSAFRLRTGIKHTRTRWAKNCTPNKVGRAEAADTLTPRVVLLQAVVLFFVKKMPAESACRVSLIRRESTRGKMLKCSGDKNEGMCRTGDGGGAPAM